MVPSTGRGDDWGLVPVWAQAGDLAQPQTAAQQRHPMVSQRIGDLAAVDDGGVVVEAAMAPLRELPTAPANPPTRALSKLEPEYHPGW